MTKDQQQKVLQQALAHHGANRLDAARQLYRKLLEADPQNGHVIHLLGTLYLQQGDGATALELIGRAKALMPGLAEVHANLGLALAANGRLDDAIAAYRSAIALRPNLAAAHNHLAMALAGKGQFPEAVIAMQRAITIDPRDARLHCNLGLVLVGQSKLDAAIESFQKTVAINPQQADAWNHLGMTLLVRGKGADAEDAIAALKQAHRLRPNNVSTFNQLMDLLRQHNHLNEAIECAKAAVSERKDSVEAVLNLSLALTDAGDLEQALGFAEKAVALGPNEARAYLALGHVMGARKQVEQAIVAYEKAIALDPQFVNVYGNLANALRQAARIDDAITVCRRALGVRPDVAAVHVNLGVLYCDVGDVDAALTSVRKAIDLNPGVLGPYSGAAVMINYQVGATPEAILGAARRFEERFARPLSATNRPYGNDRSPDRRLRIGYVSADLYRHIVGRIALPIFRAHDRGAFEVYVYSNVNAPDPFTQEIRACTDVWREIRRLSDEKVADLIRADKIDILIDLSVHTIDHRLLVFARKPTPVQVTHLGYPGTTGMTAMDYRLTDVYLDPPGEHDDWYAEKTYRLPHTFWCYEEIRPSPEVNPLPALTSGHVTFGCLNVLHKSNTGCFARWARVMTAVPGSRLIMLAPAGSARERVLEFMVSQGIDKSRIEFVARQENMAYLSTYHRIDIGLDTLPYNGHTTSLDSYWMGVPVVTQMGTTVVGRAGFSQLSNLGLSELVARSDEEFVRIAVSLAGDLPRLAALRGELRKRMQDSPLMNARARTAEIESAYRQMWKKWCVAGPEEKRR
jgi:predicted O-linked N-acetylglucosamine transferase (SPINDLY family)